jgi:hypothetical protein
MSQSTKTDETIREIVEHIRSQIDSYGIITDWKGDYFSSNQLDDLRKVLEMNGFETAKIFIRGKMKRRGNQMELKKNKIIYDLLEQLSGADSLDMSTKSYIVGKLNSILSVQGKGGK